MKTKTCYETHTACHGDTCNVAAEQHTKGPWHIGVRTAYSSCDIYGPSGELVAVTDDVFNALATARSNARRIIACVNACNDFEDPGEAIRLLKAEAAKADAIGELVRQRDEFAAALRGLEKFLDQFANCSGSEQTGQWLSFEGQKAVDAARNALAKLEIPK